MKLAVTTGLILLLGSTCLHAQQALVGTYNGTFTAKIRSSSAEIQVGLKLEITSAENGALKGTLINYGTAGCGGQYKLEGTYQDDKLQLTSDKGGRAGDCTLQFQLTAEGNKLVGKMGPNDVTLSK
jgi:hypothetical protein